MAVLWTHDNATAEDVRSALAGEPHDSTVRTLLRVLEAKGHVRHKLVGKVFVYQPVTKRDIAQRNALGNLLQRFFGGSAEKLVLRLLEEEHLSAAELQELLRRTPESNRRRSKGESP
jgi:predicted transcriptional regulator